MNFRHFIDNPVKVTMLFLALVLMGFLSYQKLPLNLFPDLQTPRITLVVTTQGLTPEETERRLTLDFERQLASIKGVSDITSFSREDNIVIHVDFFWDQDMEFAYLDVKKNVGVLEAGEYVEKVDVYRFDPNAAALLTLAFTPTASNEKDPALAALLKPSVDRVRLTNLVENSLKAKIESIEGVAFVKTNGASRREVTVLVDEDIMTQFGLTSERVIAAIREYSINSTGGTVVEGNEQMLLKFISHFNTTDDIRKCVVTLIDGHPIHLEDIGKIKISPSKDEMAVHQDGVKTVALDVFREPDANAVLTARRVRDAVQRLNSRGDYGLKIAVDRSLEVEAAISEVVRSALIGMLLAMAILWLFLRNFFATLIVAAAIPISIVATFSLMYFQHLSLNIMTLGGLALGAGMLVDNGIVVIENIFRHRTGAEGGRVAAPAEASVVGVREVALAVTAATLTTIVVFVPLVYVHGIAGILFKDQALTVVYSLLTSLLVALIMIPMLAARIAPGRATEPGFVNRGYGHFLSFSMKLRWLLLLAFLWAMVMTWNKGREIPTRFFPESVNGRLSLLFEMPLGTMIEQTERVATLLEGPLLKMRYRDPALAPLLQAYETWKMSGDLKRFLMAATGALNELGKFDEDLVAKGEAGTHEALIAELSVLLFPSEWDGRMEEFLESEKANNSRKKFMKKVAHALDPFIIIQSVTTTVGMEADSIQAAGEKISGPHSGRMEVVINPDILREIRASDIIDILRSEADTVPGLNCAFESRNEFLQQVLGKNRGDIVIEVHAEKLKDLRASAERCAKTFEGIEGLANIRTNLILGEETYQLEPDRDAMQRGQFEVSDLANQIQAYLQGDKSDEVKLEEGEMKILVKNPRAERAGLEGLLNLSIISSTQNKEKLENLIHLRRERGVREIMRVNQERTLLVMADLAGIRYQDAVASIRKALNSQHWERTAGWNVSGEEIKRRESFEQLLFALGIALVLVYMVIASILESLIHPLTIMLSVPFALAGVVAAFLLTGISLNLMGFIGIVMLSGIVVNNAIVLLDRVNQIHDLKKESVGLLESRSLISESVVLASRQRLRPIIMTSLTTILALLPLAMGFGNGAELRRPMAVAVIGGLTSSTLLTLWILPALYLCVEDCLSVPRRIFARGRARRPESKLEEGAQE